MASPRPTLMKGHSKVLFFVEFEQTLPYFFGYKTEFFSFQNDPKNLDPSSKMDLDHWDCLRRIKLVF